MRRFQDLNSSPKTMNKNLRPGKIQEQPKSTYFEKPVETSSNLNRPQKEITQSDIYSRPAWRSGMRDQVWEQAKDSHGRVRDPLTGKYMSKDKPWDMGHKPGYEFKKHQESAEKRGISREQFIDEYNNPDHLRPELPSSNRSHRGENKTENYFGDTTKEVAKDVVKGAVTSVATQALVAKLTPLLISGAKVAAVTLI